MARFKIVVLGKSGRTKYTYDRRCFKDIQQAITYYEQTGGRVIEAKELGVRLKPVSQEENVA